MEGTCQRMTAQSALRRTCSLRGCDNCVKKSTAKYCSVRCSAIDPERQARLRLQAHRVCRDPVLPMVRQLRFDIPLAPNHPEASLAAVPCTREDVPRGMSRLAG